MRSDQRRQELGKIISKNQASDSLDIDYLNDIMYDEDIAISESLSLVKDGGIRWNSTFNMLKRFKALRDSITIFLERHQPSKNEEAFNPAQDRLTTTDWDRLDQWLHLLKPFEYATLRLEGNGINPGALSFGALWEVIPTFQNLYLHLEEARIEASVEEPLSAYRIGIECGMAKLDVYYSKLIFDSDAYILSVSLHPSLRPAWFELHWSGSQEWVNKAKDVWSAFCQSLPLPPLLDTDPAAEPAYKRRRLNENDANSDEEDKIRYASLFMVDRRQLGQEEDPERAGVRINREGRDWKRFKVPEVGIINDPLAWWINEQNEHPHRFPGLSKAALNYYSAPAMSAECERVFSRAKRTVCDERARLKADTIEATECQKDWLKKGLVASPLPSE